RAVETLGRLREPGVGYSHERVVVASHQYVGEERELEALPGRGQPLEEVLPILVVHEQVARVAGASGEVVDAFVEIARAPGHATEVRHRRSNRGANHSFRHRLATLSSPAALDKTDVGPRFRVATCVWPDLLSDWRPHLNCGD